MPRPKKLTSDHLELPEAIRRTAWKQIAATGATALSLRAIARELRITAPAIYNYFADRDALVTALIIEAHTSLGDAQIEARDAVPETDLAGRLTATGLAYRTWALTYPQRYQLIFGTPLPNYVAPFEQVFPSAARSFGVLVSVVEALRQAGQLAVANFPVVSYGHKTAFNQWKKYAGEADVLSLSVAVLIWSRVHGLVSLEIGGHTPPFGPTGDALYRYELGLIIQQFLIL